MILIKQYILVKHTTTPFFIGTYLYCLKNKHQIKSKSIYDDLLTIKIWGDLLTIKMWGDKDTELYLSILKSIELSKNEI